MIRQIASQALHLEEGQLTMHIEQIRVEYSLDIMPAMVVLLVRRNFSTGLTSGRSSGGF